ncbi:hypothetical protein M9Y10_041729 [Tritrichomonas musculus]|uniref:Ankyrin repeat protein n=1 Tax=Tritrichomonas musculus TaxID=1915356 RepID=A0ABR2K560_9EUKA
MSKEALNKLFEQIKCDDVASVMQTVIQNNWFNIRFPRSINNNVFKSYPILSNRAPILGIAAYFGSYDVFRFLVSNSSDVKLSDDKNMNSIGFAIAGNNVDILELLFEMNVIDSITANEYFLYACKFNSLNVLKHYIDKLEFDPYCYDSTGKQCIHYAVLNGNIEMIQFLLDHKSDINSQTKTDSRTPVMLAAINKNTEILKFILSIEGVNPSEKSQFGDTALILASAIGSIENVKLLLQTGQVDINDQNSNGATALHIAVINNRIELIKYFLQQPQIDANMLDSGNMTPLCRALFFQHKEAMFILHDYLINTKKESESSISILPKTSFVHIATEMNSPEILDILINDWKEDVNAEGCNLKYTPLWLAIDKSFDKSLAFLLKVPGRKLGHLEPIRRYRETVFPEIKNEPKVILQTCGGEDILKDYENQEEIFKKEQEARPQEQNGN